MPKILIIEDDDYVRSALQASLEREDFDVVVASGGSQGIEMARDERPSLIVLDLAMPDLDGLEVLDRLRRDIVTWEAPIMVLTGRTDPESQQQSHLQGVWRFLRKPFSPRQVASEIKRLFSQSGI